jgi:hypothetical protein
VHNTLKQYVEKHLKARRKLKEIRADQEWEIQKREEKNQARMQSALIRAVTNRSAQKIIRSRSPNEQGKVYGSD